MVTLTGSGSDSEKTRLGLRDGYWENDRQRQLIGGIGLVLPAILIVMAVMRDGVEQWRSLDSISAYYYSGAVSAFVGMLVSLAVFLFGYQGYKGKKYHKADRAVSCIAAAAALGVALFPTAAPEGVTALSWWSRVTGTLHYGFAVVLFLMFAVFSLWLFRLSSSPDKARRNSVYLICGLVILANMIWAGIAGLRGKPIFWPESFALIAFAVSWLVKGYAFKRIAGAARSLGDLFPRKRSAHA